MIMIALFPEDGSVSTLGTAYDIRWTSTHIEVGSAGGR